MSLTRSLTRHVLGGLVRDLRDILLRGRAAMWKRSQPVTHEVVTRRRTEFVIGSIADPELDMQLMSVRGAVTISSLSALSSALRAVDDWSILHLDLTDAEFRDQAAFVGMERLIDGLEDRHVRIRIVGLQPTVAAPSD